VVFLGKIREERERDPEKKKKKKKKEKRNQKKKKKKKKVESITPRRIPLLKFFFFGIICKKQKEREREVGSVGSVSKLRWGLPRFKPHLSFVAPPSTLMVKSLLGVTHEILCLSFL